MSRTLTLHQPWASLVALGVKKIETRSWSTDYRGPLLIHAGLTKAPPVRGVPWGPLLAEPGGCLLRDDVRPLPLGAIVASCTLADVVPIKAARERVDEPWLKHVAPTGGSDVLWLWLGPSDTENLSTGRPTWRHEVIEDQRPYGDFAPGRFAWLLEDVKATTERCPACWGDSGEVDVYDGPTGGYLGPAFADCTSCNGKGSCDPVPAKGKQRLWEWTP